MTDLEKTSLSEDTILVGISASPGIAIGETYLVNRARMPAVERSISKEAVPQEIDAFMEAVQTSKRQLDEVRQGVANRSLAEHLYIIDTHLLILDDQMLLEGVITSYSIHYTKLYEFLVFTDDTTEEINVIYRRKDGNYGLIAPESK